jgi:hypothetical protein
MLVLAVMGFERLRFSPFWNFLVFWFSLWLKMAFICIGFWAIVDLFLFFFFFFFFDSIVDLFLISCIVNVILGINLLFLMLWGFLD